MSKEITYYEVLMKGGQSIVIDQSILESLSFQIKNGTSLSFHLFKSEITGLSIGIHLHEILLIRPIQKTLRQIINETTI